MTPRLDALARLLSEGADEPYTTEMLREQLRLAPEEDILVWEVEPLDAQTGHGSHVVVPWPMRSSGARSPRTTSTRAPARKMRADGRPSTQSSVGSYCPRSRPSSPTSSVEQACATS